MTMVVVVVVATMMMMMVAMTMTMMVMVVMTMITMTMMMMGRYVDKQQMGRYHDIIIVSCVSYLENTFSHLLIALLDGLSCPVDNDAS